MTKKQPSVLLISTSDFNNDSRLQRIHSHVKKAGFAMTTVAYGKLDEDENKLLSPIPVRSLFIRLFDVAKMLIARVLPEKQLLRLLATRHITKDLHANSINHDRKKPFDFVIVKHWTSLPIAMQLKNNPKIWLDINEVFEAEHDNSKLWQLIYKPVIIRLLKLADNKIALRSSTSLDQIRHMGDPDVLHLPNTKRPCELSDEPSRERQNIRLLYHGLITTNRSLETAIHAFQKCARSDIELTIRGHGKPKYIGSLKALVDKLDLSKQVRFEPSVENSQLIRRASEHDIGLCLFDNTSQQLMLSEPNKVYEYMAAGLGIIASETPTMRRMVIDENIGELTQISDQQVFELTLIFKRLSKEQVNEWQDTAYKRAQETWATNYDWPKLDMFLNTTFSEMIDASSTL